MVRLLPLMPVRDSGAAPLSTHSLKGNASTYWLLLGMHGRGLSPSLLNGNKVQAQLKAEQPSDGARSSPFLMLIVIGISRILQLIGAAMAVYGVHQYSRHCAAHQSPSSCPVPVGFTARALDGARHRSPRLYSPSSPQSGDICCGGVASPSSMRSLARALRLSLLSGQA